MPLSDYEVHDILGEYAALGPTPAPEAAWPALPELRRGRRRPVRRPPTYVSLVERDGLALWQWGFAKPHSIAHGRRAHAAGGPVALKGKEIFSDIIQPLGVNQISQLLLDFDVKRNPDFFRKDGWKLRQWHGNSQVLRDANPPGAKAPKNILLIVHGTASCCDHILSEIKLAEGGGKFLSDAARHYSAVLAFEHPTISMSPVLNALDLSAALEPYGNCNVDIVCHSRGGLVASWWMHVVDHRDRTKRCVYIGSPLQGTNLANPAKLRSSLHLLANYGRILGHVGTAAGFLALPMMILKVAASVVDFTAKTPLLDAALAMIPGLGAQSAIDNNQELLRLNARKSPKQGPPTQFHIRANFVSTDEKWKFWRYFTNNPKLRLIEAAVDTFVFPDENDLVVDTAFMLDKVGGLDFKFPSEGGAVHHTNYFEQTQTIEKLRKCLQIPDPAL